jgi:hypothetical protein
VQRMAKSCFFVFFFFFFLHGPFYSSRLTARALGIFRILFNDFSERKKKKK